MISYLIPFIISFVLSFILTKLVRNFVVKRKLAMSEPRERDIHSKPTPRLGGVAVFISFLLVVIGYLFVSPQKIDFDVPNVGSIDKNILGLLLGSFIVVIGGVVDDLKNLSAIKKLSLQILAAIVVVALGIKIHWFSNPFGGLAIELGDWSYFFIPLWIVLMINAVNWIDSIDGLASGISVIGAAVLFILSYNLIAVDPNQAVTALMAAIFAGSVLGFLPFNFNPAKIFLGDSGSMFLGFMLAVLAVISGAKVATAALVLGVPIIDAILVILRRLFNKKAIWQADKYHLPHRFLKAGFNQRQTVVLLYIVSIFFGAAALSANAYGKLLSVIILLIVVLLTVIILRIKEHAKLRRS
ncbi:MAG: Glycosyl transferase, family 4 [uncultured bacterium]|nr:MAG: Glycosyl transferase, family 4 [uncultured bacterium]